MACNDDDFADIDRVRELPKLLSSSALLHEPFDEASRFADNAVFTGEVSYKNGTVFIDVVDETPVAVTRPVQQAIKEQFGIHVPTLHDVKLGAAGNNSLIGGGSVIGVGKSGKEKLNAIRYPMAMRGLYYDDDPRKGVIFSPLSLSHAHGGAGEPLSVTVLKEPQEELQIFMVGRNKKKLKSFKLASVFEEADNLSIRPVMISSGGKTGLSEECLKEIIDKFSSHVFQQLIDSGTANVSFPLDDNSDVLSPLHFLQCLSTEPKVIKVCKNEAYKDQENQVITRIDSKIFDEAYGIPYIDVRYNTFELTSPLLLHVPNDHKVIHLLGCEPDFEKMTRFFNVKELMEMPLAPLMPFEEGVDPGGLNRASYAFFNGFSSSLSFDEDYSKQSPLFGIAQQKQREQRPASVETLEMTSG